MHQVHISPRLGINIGINLLKLSMNLTTYLYERFQLNICHAPRGECDIRRFPLVKQENFSDNLCIVDDANKYQPCFYACRKVKPRLFLETRADWTVPESYSVPSAALELPTLERIFPTLQHF